MLHNTMCLCRRAQMSGWAGAQALHAEAGHAVAYKGMVDCFMRTLREEGFQALFKVRDQSCVPHAAGRPTCLLCV